MPTYITLMGWTQQGIQSVKDSPARVESGRKAFEAMGVELKALYLVMGAYDFVAISEAPDDETAAKVALALGAQGNVRTHTMRAFTEAEYGRILAALP